MSKQNNFLTKVVPIALTVIGSISTVAAVILAAKEGPKYQKALEEKEMTTPQKITTVVKTFAPAIGCTTLSVACGVGAHMMDMHTQASLTGAYIAAQGAFKKVSSEYKKFRDKNEELNGEGSNDKVLSEMIREDLPKELRDENGEKMYLVHLCGLADGMDDIDYQSSYVNVLNGLLAFELRLLDCESITLNETLLLFGQESVDYGDDEGWSIYMMYGWQSRPYLPFIVSVDHERNEITVIPEVRAYGGFLTDYGLDF